jgi:hypothetical protein
MNCQLGSLSKSMLSHGCGARVLRADVPLASNGARMGVSDLRLSTGSLQKRLDHAFPHRFDLVRKAETPKHTGAVANVGDSGCGCT